MKLFATDYDGTLRMGDGISEENIQAINEFRAKGNLFGVVTGRSYNNGYAVFRKSGEFPFDFIIVSNGAGGYDYEGNELFSHRVEKAAVEGVPLSVKLIEACTELTKYPCGLNTGKTNYAFHTDYPDGADVDGRHYSPRSILYETEDFLSANAVCEDDKECSKVVNRLKELFGEYLNPVQNGRCIDITAKGVDKAYGVAALAKIYGVKKENIWTSGDNYNDIPMLEAFHGSAMESGVNKAKESAEFVCKSVAQALKKAMESK